VNWACDEEVIETNGSIFGEGWTGVWKRGRRMGKKKEEKERGVTRWVGDSEIHERWLRRMWKIKRLAKKKKSERNKNADPCPPHRNQNKSIEKGFRLLRVLFQYKRHGMPFQRNERTKHRGSLSNRQYSDLTVAGANIIPEILSFPWQGIKRRKST
jgi:hypothetical protein